MRRITVVFVPLLLAALALTACGSSSPSSPSNANAAVTATGTFGHDPTVTIPKAKASSKLFVNAVIKGTGPVMAKTDALVGNYAVYIWSGTGHKLATSTFKTAPQLFAGQLLPGLESALIGQKVGSRVLAVIPPKEGYGSAGNSQGGVKPTDTLVFVIDMIKTFAGNASASGQSLSSGGGSLPTVSAAPGTLPKITMPHQNPPAKLITKTLIQGTGPMVSKGQYIVVQYVGAIWRNSKVFDSSWSRNQPFGFLLDSQPAQVITGWNLGLLGQRVGSRVMLVIPPSDGYGKTGSTQAGIKGTDTLVFVVDVLGAFGI